MAKVKKSTQRHPRTPSGLEVTPEVADALASEAERGYDLSKATRQRVGRPSLVGQGNSPRMSFRTTREAYEAIQELAKRENRSVSDLAREAVESYLSTRPTPSAR